MFVAVMGTCVRCDRLFSFSATKVPSVKINGTRQPLCEQCVGVLNAERVKLGLPEISVLPGAYEADDEREVPWDD